MNPIVDEWIGKAESDFHTASRELVAVSHQNYDAVCFHAQQCIEKFVKAVLIAHGVIPPKIHDLAQIYRSLTPTDWGWSPAITAFPHSRSSRFSLSW